MFERCEFIMGHDNSMVIVLPGMLPSEPQPYTVSATPTHIKIKAGYDQIALFPYHNEEVFQRLIHFSQVGIVEYPPGESFPACITAVAYVETRTQ